MISAAVIGFLKRSQKTRVSNATSREGGGAVGINFARWAGLNPASVVLCHATVSRASASWENAAATSVLPKNNLTRTTHLTYEIHRTHETDQKKVDQTDAEDRADLFRVHLIRRCGLIE